MTTKEKPPVWFWVVSVIALIWNGLGVDNYIGSALKTERWKMQIPSNLLEETMKIIELTPWWVTAAFAIAVYFGFFGAVFLLFRKKIAVQAFYISLIAVIIQMGYFIIKGYTQSGVMTGLIILFAIGFVFFSKMARAKKWIS